MLFPVLCPGAAEVVNVAVVQERQLRGPSIRAIEDRALHAALDERMPRFGIVDPHRELPWSYRVQRPGERLGIVERGLDGDDLAVGAGPEDFHRLHEAAELEHR